MSIAINTAVSNAPRVNWTPDTLLSLSGAQHDFVVCARDREYAVLRVTLCESGWRVGGADRASIWDACYMLNQFDAVIAQPEPGHAPDCPMNNILYIARGYDLFGDKTECRCQAIATATTTATTPALQPTEPEKVTADRYYDPTSRYTWLDFGGRIDAELAHDLGASGWRWSGYRKMWRTNRRIPELPKIVEAHDQGEVHFAEERAGRLRTRAERVQTEAQARWDKAGKLADMIPFGQPILVGHHSEGRHRRDLARIETNSRKAIEGFDEAKELQRRADGSEAHQAWKHDPGAMQRRIERLRTEMMRLVRNKRGWGDLAEWQKRYDALYAEITDLQRELRSAGGLLTDRMVVKVGMTIRAKGFVGRVLKVNKKTITIEITEGGAKGWKHNVEKSWVTEIIGEGVTLTQEETPHA